VPGFDATQTTVQIKPVGNLVIDMFDGQSKNLVWRAVSGENLSRRPEKNEGKPDNDIDKMFDKFTPKKRGLTGNGECLIPPRRSRSLVSRSCHVACPVFPAY